MTKNKIAKKTIVITSVAILAMSFIAGAAIVSYLSNEVKQENIVVSSPLELSLTNHYDGENTVWNNIISDDWKFVAGSTGMFWGKVENHANNPIDGTLRIKFISENNIAGGEITFLEGDLFGDGLSAFNLLDSPFGLNLVSDDFLYVDIPFTDLAAGDTEIASLVFTLSPYAPGTYSISVQII